MGKTFIAKRLAYAVMGTVDDRRIAIVQFHPSYNYEDFIRGYRYSKNYSCCSSLTNEVGEMFILIAALAKSTTDGYAEGGFHRDGVVG